MRRLPVTIIIMWAVMLFASCELERSDNGDFDGYWQWTSVDTLATGGSLDMRSSLIFWAVGGDLLEIIDNSDNSDNEDVYFRFNLSGDSLVLYNPVIDERDSSDIELTDYSLLLPYAITTIPASFYVDHLSGSKMILLSPLYRLSFRKY